MADRIKTVSTYNGTSWGSEVPIGADASNVDVTLSNNTKTNLQIVLGSTPSGLSVTDRINSKVSTSGGDVASTVVGSDIINYDSSTDAGSDILTDTVATVNTNTSTLWSRFNLFRKKVSNNFNNYFATTNLRTEVGSAAGDNTNVYTVGAINTYLSNVVGYESGSTVPEAGKISEQLDTLNRKTTWTYNDTDYTALTMYGVDALGLPQQQYPIIMDNGANIWIGANSTGGMHHEGSVHISSGTNSDTGNPYPSIYVNIPNGASSGSSAGSTAYQVLHRGNFFVETVSATSGFNLNANSVTNEKTLNCAKTNCTVLGIMNTWLTNQTNGQGVSYCFLYAQRQDGNNLKYYVRNYSASGNATGLLIHAQVLYLKTSF